MAILLGIYLATPFLFAILTYTHTQHAGHPPLFKNQERSIFRCNAKKKNVNRFTLSWIHVQRRPIRQKTPIKLDWYQWVKQVKVTLDFYRTRRSSSQSTKDPIPMYVKDSVLCYCNKLSTKSEYDLTLWRNSTWNIKPGNPLSKLNKESCWFSDEYWVNMSCW